MEIPPIEPSELGFNPTQLMPIRIEFDRDVAEAFEFRFNHFAELPGSESGLSISAPIPFTANVGSVTYDDCRTIYVQGDCIVVEYGQTGIDGRINIMVVRQDIVDRARPIQQVPDYPIAASVDALALIDAFRAADDVLRETARIIDRA